MDTKIYNYRNSYRYKWYCPQHVYLSEKWSTILLKHDRHDEDLHHEKIRMTIIKMTAITESLIVAKSHVKTVI